MKVRVELSRTNEKKEVELKKDSKILDLLEKIGIKPDTAIVMKNKKLLPVDDVIEDNESLTILHISSSG
jgi:sulfur carrier protein ThiS